MASMRIQGPLPASQKRPISRQLDFVRVDGRYRVGKLLGTGGSGESHFNQVHLIFLNSISECLSGKRYYDRN